MRKLDQTNLNNEAAVTNAEMLNKTDDDLWSFHDNLIEANSANTSQRSQDEMPTDLKHYLNQPMVDHKENPIQY